MFVFRLRNAVWMMTDGVSYTLQFDTNASRLKPESQFYKASLEYRLWRVFVTMIVLR